LAGMQIDILHTPGHSPGSVSLYVREENVCIAGDTLFAGSIGRTDLPGGDYDTLISSIRQRLLTLPEETAIYPGHGPDTTIGDEKTYNPFVGER
jgi:hydroxyacylglutathione hydrolase